MATRIDPVVTGRLFNEEQRPPWHSNGRLKNYAAEVDCSLDERGNRPTSTCHTAYYQLREGVFLHSVFHISDDVKRQRKAYVSDIRNLWIHVGKKISKRSKP